MNKERKNLLVFGYGLAVILAVFAVRLWIKHGWGVSSVVLLVIAFVLAAVSAWRIEFLKPIYKIWMAVGHKISLVVSTLILSVLFYTAFLVTGLILRLMGKDLLNRKLEPQAASYWIKRNASSGEPDAFKRQF